MIESFADFQIHFLWVIIVGACLAFLLGFGMGANDVSNAFGTSVGSKVLSLKAAYILATIFETLGAVLVGYNVTDTMRKGIVDIEIYKNDTDQLLVGQLAILGGGSTWLILATIFKLPVSTTHSVVGATLGFTLLAKGLEGIQWKKVAQIAASWVVSPLLSGLVSSIMYIVVDFVVLRKKDPITAGMRALPFIYFLCLAFNTFVITNQGSKILHLNDIPLWLSLLISLTIGIASALIFHFVARPRLLKWIEQGRVGDQETNQKRASVTIVGENKLDENGTQLPVKMYETVPPVIKQKFEPTPKGFIKWLFPARKRQIDSKTYRLFSAIQVFTACFAGFAHGANDVSNAIGPLSAMYSIYKENDPMQKNATPIFILLYGVLATCVGLWILGHRVIKTVGQKMSEINPASGFTIEFGAAVTALLASKAGLPISTTHCLVGSVVAVGTVKSGEGVDWRIFRNIALSWVVTLPVSGGISALIMLFLKWDCIIVCSAKTFNIVDTGLNILEHLFISALFIHNIHLECNFIKYLT
ncbi:Phosphate transporter [Aphelenchoides bicaudatus]|nr:Phosphate transporter [Aphelenchoides bicaudatus]